MTDLPRGAGWLFGTEHRYSAQQPRADNGRWTAAGNLQSGMTVKSGGSWRKVDKVSAHYKNSEGRTLIDVHTSVGPKGRVLKDISSYEVDTDVEVRLDAEDPADWWKKSRPKK